MQNLNIQCVVSPDRDSGCFIVKKKELNRLGIVCDSGAACGVDYQQGIDPEEFVKAICQMACKVIFNNECEALEMSVMPSPDNEEDVIFNFVKRTQEELEEDGYEYDDDYNDYYSDEEDTFDPNDLVKVDEDTPITLVEVYSFRDVIGLLSYLISFSHKQVFNILYTDKSYYIDLNDCGIPNGRITSEHLSEFCEGEFYYYYENEANLVKAYAIEHGAKTFRY